ncbi:MAG: translational GTPase TypA [Candidatus Carbobacillus altaicus]|nr:translational GTPase TypA [Candidatus Carbobacillus altaicus]
MQRSHIRNIAIVAHVDHGKTTLVDAMLKSSRVFRDNQAVEERVLDSNALERERGITILAKNTAIFYNGFKINIIDTPGHADFGGEVERVMNMVDGVLLLVDAKEGVMPQTKFVLRQALAQGKRAVVVINKIDRRDARPEEVVNETFDLFIDLGASDEQADFPIIYTSALNGTSGHSPQAEDQIPNMGPLFETIIQKLPAPEADPDRPLQMLISLTSYDAYKGKMVIGKIQRGSVQKGAPVYIIAPDGTRKQGKIAQLMTFSGLNREEVAEASAGDIVAIAGLPEVVIGATITGIDDPTPLPPIRVEEPTISVTIGVNTSPFAGWEGTHVTSRKLGERLFREAEKDVALRVEETDVPDAFKVSGRGELHLGILIETIRREGYEFEVSKPEVILRKEDGIRKEPYEIVDIEVSEAYQGALAQLFGKRKGELTDMRPGESGYMRLTYRIPTRGMLGMHHELLTATRGEATMHSLFGGWMPFSGEIKMREHGSLVAWEAGEATTYGLHSAQERGTLFIEPGTPVYEGMVIGAHARENDLDINVCKKKQLTNFRAAGSDEALRLDVPRTLSLDEALEYLACDELLEVTPKSLRIRKKYLARHERHKARKEKESEVLIERRSPER